MAKKVFNTNDLEEVKSLSSRIMSDLSDMGAITSELSDNLKVQENLATATTLAQAGKIKQAKIFVGIANLEKEIIQSINDGSLQSYDLNEKILALRAKIPGIAGEELKQLMKIQDSMQAQIHHLLERNMLDETRADVLQKQNAKYNEQKDILKDLESSTLGIYQTAKETVKSPLASMAYVGKQIFDSFSAVRDVSRELGLSLTQSVYAGKEITKSMAETARYGATFKQNAEAFGAIVSLSGDLSEATAKSVVNVTKIGKLAGLAANEAAELNRTFVTIGGNQAIADNMTETTLQMARAAKVAPQKVFADMAANSELIFIYGKDNVDNLIKGSIAAKKLGIEFSSITQSARGLLDIESSIEAEMQASALVGRQINLNKARELSMAGDMDGYQKEIAKQLGTQAEWDRLNIIQKENLAKAMGLQIPEAARIIANQGKIKDLDAEITAGMKDQNAQLDQTADKWAFLGNPQHVLTLIASGNLLVNLLTSLPTLFKGARVAMKTAFGGGAKLFGWLTTQITTMTVKMLTFFKVSAAKTMGLKSLGTKISGFFGGLQSKVSGVQKVMKKTEAVADPKKSKWTGRRNPLVNWLNTWKRLSPAALGKFTLAVGVMVLTLPALAWGLKQFADVPWDAALIGMGALMGLAFSMKLIGNLSGQLIKGALAMVIMSAALIPAAYAFSLLAGVDPTSIIAFALALPILAAGMIALGAVLMGGFIIPFMVGVVAIAAMGGALIVLGAGLQKVSGALGGFGDIFSNIGQTFADLKPLLADFVTMGPALLSMGLAFGLLSAGLIGFAGALFIIGAMVPVLTILSGALPVIDTAIKSMTSNLGTFTQNLIQSQAAMFGMGAATAFFGLALGGLVAISGLASISIFGLSLSMLALGVAVPVILLVAAGLGTISKSLETIVSLSTGIKEGFQSIFAGVSGLVNNLLTSVKDISLAFLSFASNVMVSGGALIALGTSIFIATQAASLGILSLAGSILAFVPALPVLFLTAVGFTILSASILALAPALLLASTSISGVLGGLMSMGELTRNTSADLLNIVPSLFAFSTGLIALSGAVLMSAGIIPIFGMFAVGVTLFAGSLLLATPALMLFTGLVGKLQGVLPGLNDSLSQISFSGFSGLPLIVTNILAFSTAMFALSVMSPMFAMVAGGLLMVGVAALFASPGLGIFAGFMDNLKESIQGVSLSLDSISFSGFTGLPLIITNVLGFSAAMLSLSVMSPMFAVVSGGLMMIGGAALFASPGLSLISGFMNSLKESIPIVADTLKQISFAGFNGIGDFVTDLFSLTGAILLMSTAIPTMMVLSVASNMMAKSMDSMATSGQLLAQSFANVRDSLSGIVPSFGQLVSMTPGLYTLSSGLLALSMSIIPLAASLAVVSPLVSVIDKINSISTASEKKTEVATTPKDNTENYAAIIERLDQLISITAGGSKIYLNDRELGKWVGLHASKINAIENRG